jgi:hypothetical protein
MSQESRQRSKITRSRFRPDEDTLLRALVSTYGINSWTEIAQHLPGRNVRQCRDRWFHYLADLPAACSWSGEEDILLRQMMDRFDGSLEHMKAFFPNQTPQEIQRRWVFIKHQEGSSNTEVPQTIITEEAQTPEQIIPKRGPTELEIAHFEEVLTFSFGDNWWKGQDWDE